MTEAEAIDYYIKKLEEIFIEATPAQYVAAIVFEPVQGEGGFVPAPIEWVKAVRAICDKARDPDDHRRSADRFRTIRKNVRIRILQRSRMRARHHDEREIHRRRTFPSLQ
jgi:hypothetical protein